MIAKMGGELWGASPNFVRRTYTCKGKAIFSKVAFFKKNAMVIGIDVYHNPGGHNSWSGLVASLNNTMTK